LDEVYTGESKKRSVIRLRQETAGFLLRHEKFLTSRHGCDGINASAIKLFEYHGVKEQEDEGSFGHGH